MKDIEPGAVDYSRLRLVQLIAASEAATVFLVAMYFMGQFPPSDWVVCLIAFALASIAYGAAFYFGCLILVPQMKEYIIRDRTVIRGESVDMETDVLETSDARLNKWIEHYSFSRNLFGMGILPVLLLAGLYVFA